MVWPPGLRHADVEFYAHGKANTACGSGAGSNCNCAPATNDQPHNAPSHSHVCNDLISIGYDAVRGWTL